MWGATAPGVETRAGVNEVAGMSWTGQRAQELGTGLKLAAGRSGLARASFISGLSDGWGLGEGRELTPRTRAVGDAKSGAR